ncbi:putative immunity protein [Modestobacter italicus]|uniref:putative immunity protein n=1 Tax=Modestobacter italicus (strain DSM 44449 / CECT 9708 / BC 501) TaxID=2732864 RepID=UPI001C96A326|nr:exonuclease SbcC [Modestobacter italicus]
MPDQVEQIVLGLSDLRAVTRFAAESADEVLDAFETACPGDPRPREAIAAAWTFASGGARGKPLRDAGWAAHRAARAAGAGAAGEAARAAMHAASAAYLHPLADAHQVKHVLGSAAHAARAAELTAGDDRSVGDEHIERARRRATPAVVDVLLRYPVAPPGGGRVGELLRSLDRALRALV